MKTIVQISKIEMECFVSTESKNQFCKYNGTDFCYRCSVYAGLSKFDNLFS